MSVAPDDLTGTEQAVLLVLMAECRPVPNPELAALGPVLDKAGRTRLQRRGLIDVRAGRPMVLELTDAGWALCGALIGAEPPAGATPQSKALYTVLRGLRRHLDAADLSPAEVFAPPVAEPAQPAPAANGVGDGVEARVRGAYDALADRPGGWVALLRLRGELRDVARDDLDTALVRLYQSPGVSLIPEENQKTLTDADERAAVRIGGQDKHLIAIQR